MAFLVRKFQEGPTAAGRKQHFAMWPNIPLGISRILSEGRGETAHLSNRSAAGISDQWGVGTGMTIRSSIAVVIIMIMQKIHLMVATGSGPKKRF